MVVTTNKQTGADANKKATKAKSAYGHVSAYSVRFSDGPTPVVYTGKTSNAGGRKKLTEFNKFMQTEVARLKQENPDMPHKDRCGTSAVPECFHQR